MTTYTYPEDRTGAALSNRITGERHIITYDNARDYHFLLPVFAPFFATGVRMFKQVGATLVPLNYGTDYHFGLHFVGASLSVAQEVYGAIVPLNITDDTIFVIDYQTLGGQWTLDTAALAAAAADIVKNPRALTWEQLVQLPSMFSPTDHIWNFADMVGQTEVVNAILQIASAILNRASDDSANHTKNLLNPHKVDKAQIELDKVQNFGPAGLLDAIGGQRTDALITPAILRGVLDHLGVLNVSNSLRALEAHIDDTELHTFSKAKVGLDLVSNFPVATLDDVMRNARVQRYVTMDMMIAWMGIYGCASDTAVKTPIAQGALLHSYCNNNYAMMGTYADGKGGTYESVIKVNAEECGYQTNVPIANPTKGTILSQYCSGSTLMGLKADGSGGVFSEVLKLDSSDCVVGSGYPPSGTVLGSVCEGTTLVRTIANGSGGTSFTRTDNSSECASTAHPPSGALISYECRGFDQWGTYTDGSGGTYDAIIQRNSTDCGYVAPTAPPVQTFPPSGTVLGTTCSGYNRQEIRANGSGGTYNVTITVNSVDCGYVNTPAPTTAPVDTRTMLFSSTNTNIWWGDVETLTLIMTGWTPNTTYELAGWSQQPGGFNNGNPTNTTNITITTDRSGNGTWRLTQTAVSGIFPAGMTDNWFVEKTTQKQSNHLARRFMGDRV